MSLGEIVIALKSDNNKKRLLRNVELGKARFRFGQVCYYPPPSSLTVICPRNTFEPLVQLYHILDVSRTNETATHTHFFCGCEYLFRVGKARLSFTLPLKNWAGALFCLSVSSFCLSMFTECQVAAETLSFCILLPSHCYLILIDTMACIHWSVMSFDGIAGTARPMFHRIQWRTTVYLNQKTCAKYICYPVFFFVFFSRLTANVEI